MIDELDKALPQTQCKECGFNGCRPYAEALAKKEVTIDKCPPGGLSTLKKLGKLLSINTNAFEQSVKDNTRAPSTATIKESECIGCTKCIQVCPVDAIIGANKFMHTVIEHECTGCGLCLPACPVDCIDMTPLEKPTFDADTARKRFVARNTRLKKEQEEKRLHYQKNRQLDDAKNDATAKQAYIMDILKRKNKAYE